MNEEWLSTITCMLNKSTLFKSWKEEGIQINASSPRVHKTTHYRQSYQILITFIFRLSEKRDAKLFKDSWVPLISGISYGGTVFNLGSMLSLNLNQAIIYSKDVEAHTRTYFFTSSYLLDVVCDVHHFLGMNWRWLLGEPPIHVYCNFL